MDLQIDLGNAGTYVLLSATIVIASVMVKSIKRLIDKKISSNSGGKMKFSLKNIFGKIEYSEEDSDKPAAQTEYSDAKAEKEKKTISSTAQDQLIIGFIISSRDYGALMSFIRNMFAKTTKDIESKINEIVKGDRTTNEEKDYLASLNIHVKASLKSSFETLKFEHRNYKYTIIDSVDDYDKIFNVKKLQDICYELAKYAMVYYENYIKFNLETQGADIKIQKLIQDIVVNLNDKLKDNMAILKPRMRKKLYNEEDLEKEIMEIIEVCKEGMTLAELENTSEKLTNAIITDTKYTIIIYLLNKIKESEIDISTIK